MDNVNIHETKQPSLIVQTAIVVPLSLLATLLRFIARRKARVDLWWDDWLLLASTIFNIAFTIVSALVISYGLGRHIQTLKPDIIIQFLMTYYAGQVLYTCVLATVKWSILALYWRVFGHVKSIRIPLYTLLGLISAWFITTVAGCLFGCSPISYSWDTHQPGTCINKKAFFLAVSVVNTITDIALLALPIFYVVRLQIRKYLKALLCVAFLLGGLVCIVTFVRIGVLAQTDFNALDQSWIETTFAEWTNIECNVAIISACLPVLRPLLGRHGAESLPTIENSPVSSRRFRRSGTGAESRNDSAFATVQLKPPMGVHDRTLVQLDNYWTGLEDTGPRTTRDRYELPTP